MIKLLVFAPCERVIVSQDENISSLIVILETVNIALPVGVVAPADAIIPFRWTVFAMWRYEPEGPGVGSQYEQRTVLVSSDGQRFFETVLPFVIAADVRTHRTTVKIPGFPILPAGDAVLRLSVREAREGGQWRDVGEFPIRVNRVQ